MDIAIAVEHIALAARIAALLPVGYPRAGMWPPAKKRKSLEQIVSWERFGQSQA